jgi:hypothetical protein
MRGLRRRSLSWLLAMAAGGGALVLGGCDPAVRDTVLGGVGSAATSLAGTFIQAFFQSLTTDTTDNTATTVQADVQLVPRIFA